MRPRWTILWVFAFVFAVTLEAAQEPATPVFRVTASQVVFEFIAVDHGGRLVPDLKKDELEISVDGHKQKLDFLVPPGEGSSLGYVTVQEVSSGRVPETKGGSPATGGETDQSPREQFLSLGGQPVLDRKTLPLSRGKHRLVLVAVDRVSGAVGAAVREFSVP